MLLLLAQDVPFENQCPRGTGTVMVHRTEQAHRRREATQRTLGNIKAGKRDRGMFWGIKVCLNVLLSKHTHENSKRRGKVEI